MATSPDAVYPAAPETHRQDIPLGVPGPWRRYFARSLDGYVALALIATVFKVAFFKVPAPIDREFTGRQLLAMWMLIPFVDALIMALCGTTLGKWLLGIRVVNADGKRLPLEGCLRRNIAIWWRGYAFGIPVLSIIALALAYGSAKRHQGRSSWDIAAGNVMLRRRRNVLHYLLFCLLALIPIGLSGLGVILTQSHTHLPPHQAIPPQPSASTSWQNPLNQRIVTSDSNWHLLSRKGLPPHTVELVYAGTQDTAVLVSQPVSLGMTPERYGPALASQMTPFRFAQHGHSVEVDGVPVWSVNGDNVAQGRVTGVTLVVFRAANQMVRVVFVRPGEGDANYELRCQRLLEEIVHSYREAPAT